MDNEFLGDAPVSVNVEDRRNEPWPDYRQMQKQPASPEQILRNYMAQQAGLNPHTAMVGMPPQQPGDYGAAAAGPPTQASDLPEEEAAQASGSTPFLGPGPPSQTLNFNDVLAMMENRDKAIADSPEDMAHAVPSQYDKPFEIMSPTKIRLGAEAQELARTYFPSTSQKESNRQFAAYLLKQDQLRQAGVIQ
jgi:hypothetical protein